MPDTTYLDWPFFDDSHRELARELAAWTRSEIRSGIEDDDVDEECRSLVRRLGADGWLRYVVPARYGGMRQQLDVRSLCIAREVLAHQCALADFAFAMQGLGAGAISIFGSDEQRERYLPRVARGEAIAAFALSESDAGSDVTAMRCSAKKEGSGYVIDGQKTWISNAGIADHYVVFCRMAEGDRRFGAFVVDADNSGLRVTDRIDVISPHPLGTLAFESCEVPSEALIGKAGKGLSVALGTLDLFRPTVGAAALGFARRALDEAMSWVTERCAFGQPLAQFQLTQEKLARMAVAIDASALLVYRAAWTRDAGATRITREAAMAKLFATESAQQVIDDALQLLGGRGLVSGTPVERLYRDIRALRIYEGTSEIQKLVIAGQMLGAMLTGGESSTKNTGVGAPPMKKSAPPAHPGDHQSIASSARSAHVDTFARDNLPPRRLWPAMDFEDIPGLSYPPRLNAAAELLDHAVDEGHGDRVAIHFPDGRWTYRELLEQSNRIAHVLVEDLGVVPGNRVLLRGPNNPMMAACWFAVLKAGAINVCTMPLLRSRELCVIVEKARIRLALTDARFADECDLAARSVTMLERVVRFGDGSSQSLETLMRDKPTTFSNVDTSADDVSIIAFTSGTTGQPKGTMHVHRDLLAVCDTYSALVVKPVRDDIFCGSPPLAFTFGLGGLLLFPIRARASTLLLEQATPPHLLKGMQDHRATICFTAPTAYRAMTANVREFDLSSLRKCVSAGEHLPRATFERWRDATGIEIMDGIGSTEILHVFISASGADIRPGSTGKVVPGYRAKVVDESGREVTAGTIGSLAVQGPTGCRYLANIERQQAYVKEGWNLPGDSYLVDEDGYFWYQARTDDLIVSSGYKISGPEVENALLDHPGVAECGVVGVPDEERGSVVKAFVVLRPGFTSGDDLVKQLQDFVKARIAPYKYPRRVAIVQTLPRTDTGKLQRFRLREGE